MRKTPENCQISLLGIKNPPKHLFVKISVTGPTDRWAWDVSQEVPSVFNSAFEFPSSSLSASYHPEPQCMPPSSVSPESRKEIESVGLCNRTHNTDSRKKRREALWGRLLPHSSLTGLLPPCLLFTPNAQASQSPWELAFLAPFSHDCWNAGASTIDDLIWVALSPHKQGRYRSVITPVSALSLDSELNLLMMFCILWYTVAYIIIFLNEQSWGVKNHR